MTVTARRLFLATGTSLMGTVLYRLQTLREREASLPTDPLPDVALTSSSAANNNSNNNKPPVVIVGGGVVGITAAYKLGLAGHSVTVLEPASQVAAECSACAAGGMQRSNPVVDRDQWMAVLQCLLFPRTIQFLRGRTTTIDSDEDDYYFKFFHQSWFPTLSDPFFWRWLLTFTRTSLFPIQRQEEKQQAMLKFTKYAVEEMCHFMENRLDNMSSVAGYNTRGSLAVSYDPLPDATTSKNSNTSSESIPTHSKNSYEPSVLLVGEALLEKEPSLRWQKRPPTSARYEYETKAASSQRWTRELAQRCTNDKTMNVRILYNTKVEAVTVTDAPMDSVHGGNKPRITQLRTNRGVIDLPAAAHVIVAAGSWTPQVLALLDLYAPVYPLKGYAMSVSVKDALQQQQLKPHDLPSRIVCDKYMFTSRLGEDEIRITSIGEFSGWDTAPTPAVDAEFRAAAVLQFPQLAPLITQARTYCGHRPLVSDGILLLGEVDTHTNLWVSVGPGSNGWKLALGSAEVLQRLVAGQSVKQISEEFGFDATALAPTGRVVPAPLFAKLCRARWNV